eukprot:CAMPEP_0177612910 /NCGR_PEP_ID=MMETSP0419_2-20121207/21588_1 /TAXON_ID=582737 /ORGANISM="Tetraselmis sp., Strain GSL018" /LENGTH=108 /DNA_ID=CAMNT_0019109361 /DNA_START=349 /DNA_END=671 /DNA_ORIENTATION=+
MEETRAESLDEERGETSEQLLPVLRGVGSRRNSVSSTTDATSYQQTVPRRVAQDFAGETGSEILAGRGGAGPSPRRGLDYWSLVFGGINAVIAIPVMIAFCKVIFQAP